MIIIDKLSFFKYERLDIAWNEIFVDKIMPFFFPNTDEELIFIEVGSLHGRDTVYFKNKYKNSVCHCIEGLKANYDKYLKNLKETNLYPHNICIASYDGIITYHEKNGLESGIHGIYNRGNSYGTTTHQYNCIKFTTFCNNNNIQQIDAIKIDVEGATYDILYDMEESKLLENVKILHLETENYPYFEGQKLDSECCKILENNNFECLMKTGFKPTVDGFQYDSVWINKRYLEI